MKKYHMKLTKIPFDQIVSGKKTIESRLYDEKRQQVEVGDTITFTLIDDPNRSITKKVKDLYQVDSFEELFKILPASEFGGESTEDLLVSIRAYYSEEDEKKNGVIGIRI